MKCLREEKGGGGGRAKTEYRGMMHTDPVRSQEEYGVRKTSNVEIANTKCVRMINYPKEDQVAGPTEAAGCESIVITRIQIIPKSFRVDRGDLVLLSSKQCQTLGELRSSKQK
jgi:hypothetical protein